jgi:hypothetical protein
VRALAREIAPRSATPSTAVAERVKIEADPSTLTVETQALVKGMTAFSETRQPVFGNR